jgi:hypothetical protein
MIPEGELLARLRDLQPPPEPAFWPPAPGWWILAFLLLALLLVVLRYAPAWWRRLRLRRRLLRALDAAASPAEVSQLLRIAALERYPQAQAAGLTGERWLAFLDAESPGRFAHLRAALTEAPYRAAPIEVAPLRAAARSWLREALR